MTAVEPVLMDIGADLQRGDERMRVIQTVRSMYLLSPWAFNIAILDFALQSFAIDNQPAEYCKVVGIFGRCLSADMGQEYCLKCNGKKCHMRQRVRCAIDFTA